MYRRHPLCDCVLMAQGDGPPARAKKKKSGKSGRYKPGTKRNRKETRLSGEAARELHKRIAELEVVTWGVVRGDASDLQACCIGWRRLLLLRPALCFMRKTIFCTFPLVPPPLFQQQATVRRLQELYEHTAGEVIEERNLRLDLEAQLDAYRNPRRYRALM